LSALRESSAKQAFIHLAETVLDEAVRAIFATWASSSCPKVADIEIADDYNFTKLNFPIGHLPRGRDGTTSFFFKMPGNTVSAHAALRTTPCSRVGACAHMLNQTAETR